MVRNQLVPTDFDQVHNGGQSGLLNNALRSSVGKSGKLNGLVHAAILELLASWTSLDAAVFKHLAS